MGNHWTLRDLERAWTERGLDRRRLLQLVGAGAGMTAMTELVLASPAGAAAQDAAGSQVTIEWRKPRTLGPLFSTAGFEQQVERAIFGVLVQMTGNLEQVGDLAESFEVSDDATTFTFHIHPDATFNDGTPLTAEDVAFTLESALIPETASYWQGRLIGIDGARAFVNGEADSVEGIEIVDEKTIVLRLEAPDTAFLPTFADFSGLGILPKHILGDVAPDQLINDRFNLEPTVGAGPFQFVTYETDQYLELEPNPNWIGGAPAVSRVFLRILQPDIALAELENGTLDLISVSLDDIERVERLDHALVVSVPSPSLDSISVNLDREYFQDKRVRQAMQYAIDRQTIVDQLYQGKAIVRNSPIFGPDWMDVPEGLNEYPYDPDKARQLLQEAGWDDSVRPEMMYSSGNNATFDAMVPIIQAQWADVGFNVELLQLDATELNQKLVLDADYDLYIGGGGVYGADPSICAKYYHSDNLTPGGANNTRYVNPDVDALYAEGKRAADLEERKGVYTEIAKIINEDLPSIFLWSPDSNFAVSTRLQGFEAPSYVDNRLWNVEDWSVTED